MPFPSMFSRKAWPTARVLSGSSSIPGYRFSVASPTVSQLHLVYSYREDMVLALPILHSLISVSLFLFFFLPFFFLLTFMLLDCQSNTKRQEA